MTKPSSRPPAKPAPKKSRAETLYTHPSSSKVATKPAAPMPPSPITAPKIKHLAGVAAAGGALTKHEQRELGASVLAHIEPRKKPAP
jgi:hypothetical protein